MAFQVKSLYLEGAILYEGEEDEYLVEGFLLSESGFPDQFPVLFIKKGSGTIQLCTVASGDAAAGMGGVLKTSKGGTTYDIFLVETTHPEASPVRVKTSTGVKAIRLAT